MSRRSLNDYQKKNKYILKIEKFLHQRMDVILGNSKAVINQLLQEGAERNKVKLIYNGINLEHFDYSTTKRNCRRELNISKNDFVIIIVANLIPYKGHIDLISALQHIDSELPNWRLLIVGKDIGIKKYLEDKIKVCSLEKKIMFLGKVEKVNNVLKCSDLGVLCSHQEGFSNALLEYMASWTSCNCYKCWRKF